MKFDDIKSSFEPAPEGVHTGILAAFVDLGDQEGRFGTKRQARLKWVLPETKDDKGEVYCLSDDMELEPALAGLSRHRQRLAAWREP